MSATVDLILDVMGRVDPHPIYTSVDFRSENSATTVLSSLMPNSKIAVRGAEICILFGFARTADGRRLRTGMRFGNRRSKRSQGCSCLCREASS
jgi:hypothetical protein